MTDAPTTDAAGGGFDPGPAWSPEEAPAPAKLEEGPAAPPKKLTVSEMKKMLREASAQLNELAGDTVRADLRMTELEISLMAPGIVRYANARPEVLSTWTGMDYLKLVAGGAMMGHRVWKERDENLRADAEAAAAGHEHGFAGVDLHAFPEPA